MLRTQALFAAITFSVLLTVVAAPVGAEPMTVTGEPEEILVNVPCADLQLMGSVDQNVLVSRVRRANHRACVDIYSAWYDSAGMRCENLAWQAAKPQSDKAITNAGMVQTAAATSIVIRIVR